MFVTSWLKFVCCCALCIDMSLLLLVICSVLFCLVVCMSCLLRVELVLCVVCCVGVWCLLCVV